MNKAATIIRSKHDAQNPYFQMLRVTAQDESLSWEARGMLAYLLSKPIDWEIRVDDLKQGCGEAKVYRIIDELKNAKYLKNREKYQDEKGHWHWTPYVVFETPIADLENEKIIQFSETPATIPQKPQHGEPYTENREIKEQNTELQNTETKTTTMPQAVMEEEKKDTNGKANNYYDAAMVLAALFGISELKTKQDRSFYIGIAKALILAGIPMEEFSQYKKWVEKQSHSQGDWGVTPNSLSAKSRPSLYVAKRDAHLAQQAKNHDGTVKQQDDTDIAQAHIFNILKDAS